MTAATKWITGKALSGSLRRAAPMALQIAAGIAACGLWVGIGHHIFV